MDAPQPHSSRNRDQLAVLFFVMGVGIHPGFTGRKRTLKTDVAAIGVAQVVVVTSVQPRCRPRAPTNSRPPGLRWSRSNQTLRAGLSRLRSTFRT